MLSSQGTGNDQGMVETDGAEMMMVSNTENWINLIIIIIAINVFFNTETYNHEEQPERWCPEVDGPPHQRPLCQTSQNGKWTISFGHVLILDSSKLTGVVQPSSLLRSIRNFRYSGRVWESLMLGRHQVAGPRSSLRRLTLKSARRQ
jgi:hypothetical protein